MQLIASPLRWESEMVSLGTHKKAKYTTGTRLGASMGWDGMLAERWSHTEGELGEVEVRDTEVIVMLQGRLHVRRRGDGELQYCNAVPGTVWLCPNGVQEDMIHLYGEVKESLHIFLPDLPLSRTVAREIDVDPDTVQLHYHGGFRDPLIEQIGWAIHAEMTDPVPAGKMLIETLAAALGIHVVRQYSNMAHASKSLPPARGALDPRRLRRVAGFIEAHLEEDLSIETLANEAYLSPFHFARAFKVATGKAPHRYVTDLRIKRAKVLIAAGELPLTEVAAECGFSSRAYFTRWFKRIVGATPGEYWRNSGARPPGTARVDTLDGETMDLTTERHADVLSIYVSGRIDQTTTTTIEEEVQNATRETDRAVILDMGDVTVISDCGLQTILQIARELQDRAVELVLCARSARAREKFRVTGLDHILPIHESRAEALASLES